MAVTSLGKTRKASDGIVLTDKGSPLVLKEDSKAK